jgi:CTP:molybdopterin cytidylyltransferase MocA
VSDSAGLGAIVLAAGASTRMGRPKASIRWRGATFVEHATMRARAAGCNPIVIVSGAVELAAVSDAIEVHNARWPEGQLSSLQAGVRAVLARAPTIGGCLIFTVDRPAVQQATVDALVAAWRSEPKGLWQPRHRGRSGHPMLYPADLLPALLALAPDSSARELVRSEPVRTRRRMLDVDDAGVVLNVDTPEDLRELGS